MVDCPRLVLSTRITVEGVRLEVMETPPSVVVVVWMGEVGATGIVAAAAPAVAVL